MGRYYFTRSLFRERTTHWKRGFFYHQLECPITELHKALFSTLTKGDFLGQNFWLITGQPLTVQYDFLLFSFGWMAFNELAKVPDVGFMWLFCFQTMTSQWRARSTCSPVGAANWFWNAREIQISRPSRLARPKIMWSKLPGQTMVDLALPFATRTATPTGAWIATCPKQRRSSRRGNLINSDRFRHFLTTFSPAVTERKNAKFQPWTMISVSTLALTPRDT